MKNKYVKPELEIIEFTAYEIICTSYDDGEPEQLTVVINGKTAENYGSSTASMFEL